MNTSKISIIVPVYNGRDYIEQCVESLVSQTYSNWEAIFVNDGSTDDSLNLLEYFALSDERFTIVNKINEGVAVARQVGVKFAKGEFITFLDIDDTLPPYALHTWLNYAIKHHSDIIHSGFTFITPNNTYSQKIQFCNLSFIDYYKCILTGELGWQLCGKIFKRTLFNDSIITPQGLKCGEDCAVLIQLIHNARTITLSDICCYNYHQYSSSTSHRRSNSMGLEMLKARDFVIAILDKYKISNKLSNSAQIFELLCLSSAIRKGLSRKDSASKDAIRRIDIKSLLNLPIKKIANIILFILR